MRRAATLALALATSGSVTASGASCGEQGMRSFARKADLPRGAAAALGFALAERGAPFQVSDAIGPGPQLPFARFISARQTGCTLVIRYEQGGIAHTFNAATLERRGNRWVLLRDR